LVILVIVIVLVLVLAAFLYIMKYGQKLPGQITQNNVTPAPAIQNTSDLDSATKQLDNTNLNQMDTGINQAGADSSSF